MEHTQGVSSTAAIGGHPIHPILVSFPIAFLLAALVTDLAYRRTSDSFWARASYWLTAAGLAAGLLAALSGLVDFLTISRAREHADGWFHMIGNAAVLGLAALSLWVRRLGPEGRVTTPALALSTVIAALLAVTGWFGGELSFRHMIGVTGHQGATEGADHHADADGSPGMPDGHGRPAAPSAGSMSTHVLALERMVRESRRHSEAALKTLDELSAALRELEQRQDRPAPLASAMRALEETRGHVDRTLGLVGRSGDAQLAERHPHDAGPRPEGYHEAGRPRPAGHGGHAGGDAAGATAYGGHGRGEWRAADPHEGHDGGGRPRPGSHVKHGEHMQSRAAGGGHTAGQGLQQHGTDGAPPGGIPEGPRALAGPAGPVPRGVPGRPAPAEGVPSGTAGTQVLPSLRGTPGFREPGRARQPRPIQTNSALFGESR